VKSFSYSSPSSHKPILSVFSLSLTLFYIFHKTSHLLLVICLHLFCSKQYMQHNMIKCNTTTNFRKESFFSFYTEYFCPRLFINTQYTSQSILSSGFLECSAGLVIEHLPQGKSKNCKKQLLAYTLM
jgi:hypothetical protein